MALQEQYDYGIVDIQDVPCTGDDANTAKVQLVSLNLSYPANSTACWYNVEASNEEVAGAATVAVRA